MVKLLHTFNDGLATSSLREACPVEQSQRNDTKSAETPTKTTTATTGTSIVGWKEKRGVGELLGSIKVGEEKEKGGRDFIYPYFGQSFTNGGKRGSRGRDDDDEKHGQGI
jgi:hypothetical protein